jgi:hypothetical protein
MCRVCLAAFGRIVLAIATLVIATVISEVAGAQEPAWNVRPQASYSMGAGGPAPAVPRGPLARLVATPDRSGGFPPFALADQSGMIQRYVEPVPGIDLAPYVGQVVVVRHDTGRTLLASQLELPPPPLYPMVGEAPQAMSPPMGLRALELPGEEQRPERFVQQAQYADSDDATVELLGFPTVIAVVPG